MSVEVSHEPSKIAPKPFVEAQKPREVPTETQLGELRDSVQNQPKLPEGIGPDQIPAISLPSGPLGDHVRSALDAMKLEYESEEAQKTQSNNIGFMDSIRNVFKRISSFFSKNDGSHIGYAPQYQVPSSLLSDSSEADKRSIISFLRNTEKKETRNSVLLKISYMRTQLEDSLEPSGDKISGLNCQVGQVVAFSLGNNRTDRIMDLGVGSEHAGVISKIEPLTIVHYSGGKVIEEPFTQALHKSNTYQITTHTLSYDGPKVVEYMKKKIGASLAYDVTGALADNGSYLGLGKYFTSFLSFFRPPRDRTATCSTLISEAIHYSKTGSIEGVVLAPNATYFASHLGVEKNIVVTG